MTQGRCTNCTILLQKDVSPVHAATVIIKWLRSGSGAVHRQRHLRHVVTEVSVPCGVLWGHVKEGTCKREPRDLPELKTTVTECVRAVTAQGCRRVLVEVRRRVEICLAKNGRHSDYLLQFPERGSNGDDKRWI